MAVNEDAELLLETVELIMELENSIGWVDDNYYLCFVVSSLNVSVNLQVNWSIKSNRGSLTTNSDTLFVLPNSPNQIFKFNLTKGVLTSVYIPPIEQPIYPGSLYISCYIIPYNGSHLMGNKPIFSGYYSSSIGLGSGTINNLINWPNIGKLVNLVIPPAPGPGLLSFTCPTYAYMRIIGLSGSFINTGSIGAEQYGYRLTDSLGNSSTFFTLSPIIPSGNILFSSYSNTTPASSANSVSFILPDNIIMYSNDLLEWGDLNNPNNTQFDSCNILALMFPHFG